MSNDIAECGCEGHADNFEACKYPELQGRLEECKSLMREGRRLLKESQTQLARLEHQRDTAWRALEDVFKGAGETWRSKPPDARPWWFRSVEGALERLPLPTTVVDAPNHGRGDL